MKQERKKNAPALHEKSGIYSDVNFFVWFFGRLFRFAFAGVIQFSIHRPALRRSRFSN